MVDVKKLAVNQCDRSEQETGNHEPDPAPNEQARHICIVTQSQFLLWGESQFAKET